MDGVEHGFELPQPQLGGEPDRRRETRRASDKLPNQVEKNLAHPELPASGGLAPVSSITAQLASDNGSSPAGGQPLQDAADTSSNAGLPAIADDNDLIEKEWVTKAKQIVETTKDDPHRQNHEINKFKAGYMKKRYNKDLKTSEE